MNPSGQSGGPPPDEALLSRVQQDNQRQILGKLLHDLRNPVHSIRISMELFGRLARRQGDIEKLFARAGAYIGPAEAAVDQLGSNTARLATYLSAPAAAAPGPLEVGAWLREIATLLKGAHRKLQVSVESHEGNVATINADRPRLSHALLHWCLNQEYTAVSLAIRPENAEVWIDVAVSAGDPAHTIERPPGHPLAREELATLVVNAGGSVRVSTRGISLGFSRAG